MDTIAVQDEISLAFVAAPPRGFIKSVFKRALQTEVVEEADGRGCVYFCNLSAVTPPENVKIAVDAALAFRRGERPWKGLRRAGTPEARGETGEAAVQIDDAAIIAAAMDQEVSEEDRFLDEIFDAVLDHEDRLAAELVAQGLEKGIPVHSLLDDALIAAMDEVGEDRHQIT